MAPAPGAGHDGGVISLRAGRLEADVAPEAGMVVASLRHDGVELLGVRGGLDAYREHGSTFGVPLLYPFANRLSDERCPLVDARGARRDENGLPIHGLPVARGPWRVEEASAARVRGALDWDEAAFAPPHRVVVVHALDERGLTVTTRVEGEGVPVAFGWHPYLAVDRAATEVEIPALRRHALDGRGLPTGEVEEAPAFAGPLGDRTFDDLYEAPPGARFRAGAVTVVFGTGARWAQVFAPASEPVIAFEPMTAPTNALVSGEGLERSPAELRFRIAVA